MIGPEQLRWTVSSEAHVPIQTHSQESKQARPMDGAMGNEFTLSHGVCESKQAFPFVPDSVGERIQGPPVCSPDGAARGGT